MQQREHEERYEYAQEWIDVVKRAWSDEEEFDFAGKFFKLAGVRAKPRPYGGTRPIIMNAGASATGQAFALRNCDAFFTSTARNASCRRRHHARDRRRGAVRRDREAGQ